MPWWGAAVLVICIVVFGVLAFLRSDSNRMTGIAVIVLVLAASWSLHEYLLAQNKLNERRALDARVSELVLRAASSDSPLACLAVQAGEAIELACEQALFESPRSSAAALAYAQAHLDLLRDVRMSIEAGQNNAHALAALRAPVEMDRFGIFAQAFAVRDQCTPDRCDAAVLLLSNPERILGNLQADLFQSHIARHAGRWGQPNATVESHAAPVLRPTASPVPSGIDFPSAESIPPVSIMNSEPERPVRNDTTKPNAARPNIASPNVASPGIATPGIATPGIAVPNAAARAPSAAARGTAEKPNAPIPLAPPRPAENPQ